MTSKEKAEELWWRYYNKLEHTLSEEYSPHEKFICKECALITVYEILSTFEYSSQADELSKTLYWEEVIKEIQKL